MSNSLESQLRHKLAREGYLLRKSRIKSENADNLGGYMIVDENTNAVISGSRFDLNLEDVKCFLQSQ